MVVLRSGLRGALALACLGASGCVSRPPVPLRVQPVPYADTLPIAEPREREPNEVAELVDAAVTQEVGSALSPRRALDATSGALNVTRDDDVVPSAWYELRHRWDAPWSPEAVRRGGTTSAGPDTSGVLRVVAAKVQGISPGFTVRDALGDRYVIKFDPKGFLHLASAAGVISNRLLYASGFHTPEDYIVVFDPARLVADSTAMVEDEEFRERPMTHEDIARVLALTDSLPDGRYLAVASKFVPGVPKGPFRFEGRREDDPNDHYLHQHRRELRGLYVVSSWINHVDMRFANTLDAYVEPGYLRHYLIDFAATLGSGTIRPHYPREGTEYNFDFWPTLARIFTLGFYTTGWEGREGEVIHPTIGWMQGEAFDPATWKANWPNEAFRNVLPPDGYWGAKLVAAFTDAHIAAAVDAGELPDPFAADTLADMLEFRRDRIVRHWFSRVTPIEAPEVRAEPGRLEVRFTDLAIASGLWEDDVTRYEARLRHAARGIDVRAGRVAAPGQVGQRLAFDLSADAGSGPLAGEDAIARLEITARRPGARGRPATIYLCWEDGGYRVAGLEH